MNYYIRIDISATAPELPISEAQFHALKINRNALNAAFAIEESYDLLIQNYREFEQALVESTANKSHPIPHDYQDFFELRSTINRRIVNLLSANRSYLEQTEKRLSICATNAKAAPKEFIEKKKEYYKSCFGFRFIEALRNHTQHCGSAVHRVDNHVKWVNKGEECVLEVAILPFTQKRAFSEDLKYNKSIHPEMQEEVLLTPFIREHVQRIGDLHKFARGQIEGHIDAARQEIQSHISRYAEKNNGCTTGLRAFGVDAKGKQETVPLFLDWDDIRVKLVKKNPTIVTLGANVGMERAP